MIGDKTFGLLIAHCLGARVPATTAVTRRLPPFSFGRATGSGENWLRTAPSSQEPGYFTTSARWLDPFELLRVEDPERRVAAVLAQEAVPAVYSGASLPRAGGGLLVEGVEGSGERFMLGSAEPVPLPASVERQVAEASRSLAQSLGPVRIEWAYDGVGVWVLQLHRASELPEGTISPGAAVSWLEFDPADGLDKLRELITLARSAGAGIRVTRPVGVTSHVGDLLRKAAVPARFGL